MIGLKPIIKKIIPSTIIRQKLDKKNCILFTFDDGPHPEITSKVLDILDEYGAKGLFFIPVSRINRKPALLKEIINRKHGIGNHGTTHTPASKLSFRQNINEIKVCQNEIRSYSGIVTELFRPPCGVITPSLIAATYCSKHKIIRWSIDSGDYSYMKNGSSSDLAKNFFKIVHDRAIVLSHDDKDTTPDFLKLVLPRLVDQGYDMQSGLSSIFKS